MKLEAFLLITAGIVTASPLTDRANYATCSSINQIPKCCQILLPVNVLGKTVDTGVGCATCMQCHPLPIKVFDFAILGLLIGACHAPKSLVE